MVPTATFTQIQSLSHTRYAEKKAKQTEQPSPRPTSIIFDLGDVLFTWTAASPASPLPPKVLKAILRSSTWFEYERGNLNEQTAYNAVAEEFGVSDSDVALAFQAARDSLQSCPPLLDAIRELKATGINIYAMSNISAPDWEVLKTKASSQDWALFDNVFIS
jgi:FMN phosphatase YigB (HAD superfamily)